MTNNNNMHMIPHVKGKSLLFLAMPLNLNVKYVDTVSCLAKKLRQLSSLGNLKVICDTVTMDENLA